MQAIKQMRTEAQIKSKVKLSDDIVSMMLFMYERGVKIKHILAIIGIDRKTLYKYVNAEPLKLRQPTSGNRFNHPTKEVRKGGAADVR